MLAFEHSGSNPEVREVSGRPGARHAIGLAVVLASMFLGPSALAQDAYEQVIQLLPGWNSIYLEVQPDPAQIGDVFGPQNCGVPAVPLMSVWTFEGRFGGVGTVIDPTEALFTTTGWFGWFPPERPESVLNNLFAVNVRRAYLVKLGGTQPITCSIPGVPLLRFLEWVPDSFNLTGLQVDPANPPTFESYFAPSAAHAGQPIFRLDPGGTWQPVLPFVEEVRAGEAYWIYTSGPSDFRGPLEVDLGSGDEIDFRGSRNQHTLTFRNLLDVDAAVTLRQLSGTAPVPLKYKAFNDGTDQLSWPELPGGFSIPIQAENKELLTIAPDRSLFSGRAEGALEVTSEFGARVLVFVSAIGSSDSAGSTGIGPSLSRPSSPRPGSSAFGRSGGSTLPPTPAAAPSNAFTGLWVGEARVSAVSEILCVVRSDDCVCRDPGSCSTTGQSCVVDTDCGAVDDVCAAGACSASGEACAVDADCPGVTQVCIEDLVDPGDALECEPACDNGQVCSCAERRCESVEVSPDPQPTGDAFPLRLLIHVDRQGEARLLKEVIQLFKQPVMGPDPATPGFQTVIDPGSFVLITDDDLIPDFGGVAMRDGKPVGLRISTAAYDFDETTRGWEAGSRALPMLGSFSDTGVVSVSIEMGKNFPTNPFLHRYHPDHNNLDAQFLPMFDVCSLTEFSCSTDEDCHFAIPQGGAACLASGETCDPANGDGDCFWGPIAPGSRVCLGNGNACAGPVDCGNEGPCVAGEGVCEGSFDPCTNDGNCFVGTSCVQIVKTGACQPADGSFLMCQTSLQECSVDADCQRNRCEQNDAACTTDESCLEIDIQAPVSICAGDAATSCDADDDCGADGPCIVRRVCEADRGTLCSDDTECVQVPPPPASGNHLVCDGNVLRACATDADCSGVNDDGTAFDDGTCVEALDDGPCVPVRYHGECADEYTDVATENPCVDGADLGPCRERSEAPAIRRSIALNFQDTLGSFCTQGCGGPDDPDTPEPPGCTCEPPAWGSDQIGGTYTETVIGLHRVDIQTTGEFTLRRLADTPVLNREP